MKKQTKLTIKGRLNLIVGLAVTGLLVVSLLSILSLMQLRSGLDKTINKYFAKTVQLSEIESRLSTIDTAAAIVLTAGDQFLIDQETNTIKSNLKKLTASFPKMDLTELIAETAEKPEEFQKDLQAGQSSFLELTGAYLAQLKAGNKKVMKILYVRGLHLSTRQLQSKYKTLTESSKNTANELAGDLTTLSSLLVPILALVGLAIVILLFLFGKRLSSNIINSVKMARESTAQIASGNFMSKFASLPADELGQTLADLDQMQSALRSSLNSIQNTAFNIRDRADSFEATSSEIYDIASQQVQDTAVASNAAQRLSASLNDTAKVTHALNERTEATNKHITEISSTLASTYSRLDTFRGDIGSFIERAQQGQNNVTSTTGLMKKTIESANQISEVVKIIASIAEKTNLLAINASIEAARAGDQGRGFAVVATEISTLADNTNRSLAAINDLVAESNQHINQSAEQIVGMSEAIGDIIQSVNTMADYFDSLYEQLGTQSKGLETFSNDLKNITSETQRIAQASASQGQNADTVFSSVRSLAHTAERGQQISEQVYTDAKQLAGQSVELRENVGKFKISN